VTFVTAVLMHRTAKYFITFTPKCFALAVAAVGAELRAILPGFGHPGTYPNYPQTHFEKPGPKQSNFDVIFHSNKDIFY